MLVLELLVERVHPGKYNHHTYICSQAVMLALLCSDCVCYWVWLPVKLQALKSQDGLRPSWDFRALEQCQGGRVLRGIAFVMGWWWVTCQIRHWRKRKIKIFTAIFENDFCNIRIKPKEEYLKHYEWLRGRYPLLTYWFCTILRHGCRR